MGETGKETTTYYIYRYFFYVFSHIRYITPGFKVRPSLYMNVISDLFEYLVNGVDLILSLSETIKVRTHTFHVCDVWYLNTYEGVTGMTKSQEEN